MKTSKYSTEELIQIVRNAISVHRCDSVSNIAKETGISEVTLRRRIPDFDPLFEEYGVIRRRRGLPRRNVEEMVRSLEEFVRQQQRWIPQEEMASHVGMTGMGLRRHIKDTNEICSRMGFPKPTLKGHRDAVAMAYYSAKAKQDYVEYVRSQNRRVIMLEFCEKCGYSYDSIRHQKFDLEEIHREAGVKYDRFAPTYCYDELRERCARYILEEGRYVTSNELRETLGYSRSTIFAAIPSLTEFNADLGFYSTNMGFEHQVYSALSELFPNETIIRQKKFDDLISDKGRHLRYDFYLPGLNLLVEADGDQHYKEVARWYSKGTWERDRVKDAYAKAKGILLLRIRYSANFQRSQLEALLSGIPLKLSVGQPAAKPEEAQEGSETIPEGSRGQAAPKCEAPLN